MDQRLKQRLVGAAILVGSAVVFIPMLFDNSKLPKPLVPGGNIPPHPQQEFSSKIVPLDEKVLTDKRVDTLIGEVGKQVEEAQRQSVPAPRPREPGARTVTDMKAGAKTTEADGAGRAAVREGVSAWVVQLGSFRSEKNARTLEKKLRSSGYAAFVETIYTDAGKSFRVRIGPELLHEDAARLKKKLAKALDLKGIVVRYP